MTVDAQRPSVWSELATVKALKVDGLDVVFSAEPPPKKKAKTAPTVNTLLSPGRGMHMGIMIRNLRLAPSEVRTAILRVDDTTLSIDNLDKLKRYVPTDDETKLLREYGGEVAKLTASDQYVFEVMSIPRLSERLSCMLCRRKLDMEIEELKPDIVILRAAARELRESPKLKILLSVSRTLSSLPHPADDAADGSEHWQHDECLDVPRRSGRLQARNARDLEGHEGHSGQHCHSYAPALSRQVNPAVRPVRAQLPRGDAARRSSF